jgi:tRNA(Glu) U13 pseudouridine synthase TruD
LKNVKVLSTEINGTSDFAKLEVKKGEDTVKLLEKIANSLHFGVNNKFEVEEIIDSERINSEDYLMISILSDRIDDNSFVREVL